MESDKNDQTDIDISDYLEDAERFFQKAEEHDKGQLRLGKTPIAPDDELIIDWWERVAVGSEEFPVEFLQFIALWEAFNGLLTCRLPLNERRKGDKQKVLSISNDPKLRKVFDDLLTDKKFKYLLDKICSLCPVYQTWGGERTKACTIKEPYDLTALLRLIYTIRCNLFHGEKHLRERDLVLTDLACKILHPLYKTARFQLLFTPALAQASGE